MGKPSWGSLRSPPFHHKDGPLAQSNVLRVCSCFPHTLYCSLCLWVKILPCLNWKHIPRFSSHSLFCFVFCFNNTLIEIEFTYHTIHPLQVYNSRVFLVCLELCNQCRKRFYNILITPQRNSIPTNSYSSFLPTTGRGNHPSTFCLCEAVSCAQFTR